MSPAPPQKKKQPRGEAESEARKRGKESDGAGKSCNSCHAPFDARGKAAHHHTFKELRRDDAIEKEAVPTILCNHLNRNMEMLTILLPSHDPLFL